MNAGAYGGEMKQVVTSVTVFRMDGTEQMLSAEASAFGYRTSVYQTLPCVIVRASLQLQPGDPDTIAQTMRALMEKRKASQPLELPSAGSTFKRPVGYFAGPLIEQAGLKGQGIGGAAVSEKARRVRRQLRRRHHGRYPQNDGTRADARAGDLRCAARARGPHLVKERDMQFVIISGMSGAGKSKAASDLEDLGFYCVDNMPAEMIPQFAQLCLATKGRYEKVALVTDVRASMTFDALFQALQKLDEMHLQYSIYYIEASTEVIIKRYKETRRLHPLMKDGSTLADAIGRERELPCARAQPGQRHHRHLHPLHR